MSFGSFSAYNYQDMARYYRVGDEVYPFAGAMNALGVVVAVHPAIGMVDVQFPQGQRRHPIEDLKCSAAVERFQQEMRSKVASAYMKKAIYWADRDRKYRATNVECQDGMYYCPKCKPSRERLQPTVYKRENGRSLRLLGCHNCLFLIKEMDVHVTESEE
jgi:hypothetical protein